MKLTISDEATAALLEYADHKDTASATVLRLLGEVDELKHAVSRRDRKIAKLRSDLADKRARNGLSMPPSIRQARQEFRTITGQWPEETP